MLTLLQTLVLFQATYTIFGGESGASKLFVKVCRN